MKTIRKIIDEYPLTELQKDELRSSSLLFDIETTGFSAAKSSLYLIGCLYLQDDNLLLEQFFAENKEDEVHLLQSFAKTCEKVQRLVSFNGLGFDIPYLEQKYQSYDLECAFLRMEHVDYYTVMSPFKKIFGLENFKLKTVESFLGDKRLDLYSGGELIETYRNYRKNPDEDALRAMLLHNEEDVIGLLSLANLLTYRDFFIGGFVVEDIDLKDYTDYTGNLAIELLIQLSAFHAMPKKINYRSNGTQLAIEGDRALISVPVIDGNLKFYYSNYKDYWYFPKENLAVHKSVASFASRSDREKATPENACQFIPASSFFSYDDTAKRTFIQNRLEHLLV